MASGLHELGGRIGMTPAEVDNYFETIGRDCETESLRVQFLSFCVARSLDPRRGDAHPIVRNTQSPPRSGKWVKVLTPVTSYHVFVGRARAKGWVISGAAVSEGDEWQGWNAVEAKPVCHVVTQPDGGRRVLGAWARAVHLPTGLAVGSYYPWAEIVQTGKDDKPSRGWASMPSLMAFKAVAERVCRLAEPDEFGNLYGHEEMGVDLPSESGNGKPAIQAPTPAPPQRRSGPPAGVVTLDAPQNAPGAARSAPDAEVAPESHPDAETAPAASTPSNAAMDLADRIRGWLTEQPQSVKDKATRMLGKAGLNLRTLTVGDRPAGVADLMAFQKAIGAPTLDAEVDFEALNAQLAGG